MMYVTKEKIGYYMNYKKAIIPKGTIVVKATNMPKDSEIKFWAKTWRGMSEEERSWGSNVGFGLRADEVEIKK